MEASVTLQQQKKGEIQMYRNGIKKLLSFFHHGKQSDVHNATSVHSIAGMFEQR